MFPLTDFLQISLFIYVITGFVIALILMLISIPKTPYSTKLANTKNVMACCFLACSATMAFAMYHYQDVWDFNYFSAMMLLVVTSISVGALSYALINLIDENYMRLSTFLVNMVMVCLVGVLLARVFLKGPSVLLNVLVIMTAVLQIIQCLLHMLAFHKAYNLASERLDDYFDEFEDRRLKWIRFAFWMMMLTELFVLVYIAVPVLIGRHVGTFMAVYGLWLTLFTIYFTSNLVSFIGSHKLLLDAFAHPALAGDRAFWKNIFHHSRKADGKDAPALAPGNLSKANERQLARLEKNLEQWVADKKYREYDKSRQEIAAELKTTTDMILLYFNMKVGVDFRTWRTRLRIEDAKQLLLDEPDTSISTISERCGFSDRSNFHKQFTSIVGCSPKAFREANPPQKA
ncbi:MAG: helix-turn-helix domain-containing protein [Bacteroidales bacterium]|nr:helix-turn-helix domain-containing protein [Bacteroidales bacterium]